MDCKNIRDLIIADYTDGNLKGVLLREVEAHLEVCDQCRNLAGELKSVRAILARSEKEAPPAEVWNRIRSEIGQAAQAPVCGRKLPGFIEEALRHLRPAIALAAAAAVMIIILTAVRIIPYGSVSGTAIDQDDILATSYYDQAVDESDYDFGTGLEEYFL